MPFDGIGEKCGVVALYDTGPPVARLAAYGLTALQHRGQEAAGVVVGDGSRLLAHHGLGLVYEACAPVALNALTGHVAVGHVRYSTAGGAGMDNVQPLVGRTGSGCDFALAHNGNLLAVEHDGEPGGAGVLPDVRMGNADTHVLVSALADHKGDILDALRSVLPLVQGAFSLVVISKNTLYAARDPHGFRPLCLGQLGDGWMVASESAALDCVGAEFVREVEPGELVTVDGHGVHTERFGAAPPASCLFEYIYFARQDSSLGGSRVQQVRRALGDALAQEAPADADVVIPIPDTARPATMGFAARSGLPFEEGLARNNYVGRSFIRPNDTERQLGIRMKFNPIPEVVCGRRVVVVDDSIVRAHSARAVTEMLRAAGATEVHLRVASAPIRWPCFFGIDISSRKELVAADHSIPEIADLIGADTLGFLTVSAMLTAAGGTGLCTGCFTGTYPVKIPFQLT